MALTLGDVRAVSGRQSPSTAGAVSVSPQRELLNRYCVTCHNQKRKTAGLMLDTLDVADVGGHADAWEKVVRKVAAGLMPPAGALRPDRASSASLVQWLETELDRAAAVRPNPGRTDAFHRLNRAEYQNAIRDLLALDNIDVDWLPPPDDASGGFDNVAGVLKLSQSLLEQYLFAARAISRAAVGSSLPAPNVQEFRVPEALQQYRQIEGLPLGTRGGLLVHYNFPQDGDYEIATDLLCRIDGECDGSVGFADQHQLEVLVDGARIKLFTLESRKDFRPPKERTWRVRVPVTAGPHDVGATFLELPAVREADSAFERFQRPYYVHGTQVFPHQTITQPFVDRVTLSGPFNAAGPGDTPSRRRIFRCQPSSPASEPSCAKTIVAQLARRAYRRPLSDEGLQILLTFYSNARAEGAGFDGGIEAALQRLLVSPEFLFRVERDPANVAPNTNYRITDVELASRLSFFLWSSIPDDQLLNLAERGKLRDPAVLEQQVRRMLADARSEALVNNFTGQWLMLRNLDAVKPELSLFPNFDDSLRQAFRRETELFFTSILRENRSVVELLTADYTFVNERLAKHYGIPKVYGPQFRRVRVTDENRRGLLGQGSILTVTSRPNRTSPVLRGKWVLENIMGTPPPDPPANVPKLQEVGISNHSNVQSVRERLQTHRANPICAGCHAMIDPPGFALENFDAVGRWRAVDERFVPVDASGMLSDGTKFNGLAQFKSALLADPESFVTTATRKLLTYALGRGLEPYDMPAVRRIVREASPGGSTLSSLVVGIVKSAPFQMRRSADASGVSVAAAARPSAAALSAR